MPILDPTWIDEFGITGTWGFATFSKVTWRDVDLNAHANHLGLLAFCEDARNDYVEALGMGSVAEGTAGPIIIKLVAEFAKPLNYGETACVTIRTKRLGNTSLDLEHAIWRDGFCGGSIATCVIKNNVTGENLKVSSFQDVIEKMDGVKSASA